MFNSLHYVPLLKGKKGEFDALKELSVSVKPQITPLIEIPPIDWDYAKEKFTKSIDDHIKSFPHKIGCSWGTEHPVFIDLANVEPGETTTDGQHPLNALMFAIHDKGITAIPVTSVYRSPDFQKAVVDVVKAQGQGVCLRLTREEIDDFVADESTISELIKDFDLSYREFDLIFDLKDISSLGIDETFEYCRRMIQALPHVDKWRTLTIAGCSFPDSLAFIPANSSKNITRNEYIVWKRLAAISKELPRVPSFGDYGISHTEFPDVDPRIMKMSVNLRYTTDQSWLILKARGAHKYGFPQFNKLCRILVPHKEYLGRDFSWGDKYIFDCSKRDCKPPFFSTNLN